MQGGWFDVLAKISAREEMHELAHCHDAPASHQLAVAVVFWTIWIVAVEACSSLMQNSMQIHRSTQSFWTQWPHSTHTHSMASTAPTDSTVKSSSFTHTHSSPFSLAARLHWCRVNHSRYINNGWTFSRETVCVWGGGCVYGQLSEWNGDSSEVSRFSQVFSHWLMSCAFFLL